MAPCHPRKTPPRSDPIRGPRGRSTIRPGCRAVLRARLARVPRSDHADFHTQLRSRDAFEDRSRAGTESAEALVRSAEALVNRCRAAVPGDSPRADAAVADRSPIPFKE